MSSEVPFQVRFEVVSEDRFASLVRAYERIRECKSQDRWPDEKDEWLPYFDSKALGHFWWPTEAELEVWKTRYLATPVPKRFTDPALQHSWDFMSLFDAFKNGDYALLSIERLSDQEAALRFDPLGYPFGGTGCMRALIEAFDHRVTHDDGSPELEPAKRWWEFWK